MKLREIRDEIKKQYKDSVIIIKYGNFYRVFDEDTYIIHYLKNYKIHDNIVGFPINIINDIKKELDSISVSYIIYDKCMINYNNIHNQYEVVLKLSKKKYEKEILLDKIKQLNINEIKEIIDIWMMRLCRSNKLMSGNLI